jgi:hypothetical protein
MKAITIEHLKAVNFPPLPLFDLAPEANWNLGHPKIEVRQFRELLAVNIAALHYNSSAAANLF